MTRPMRAALALLMAGALLAAACGDDDAGTTTAGATTAAPGDTTADDTTPDATSTTPTTATPASTAPGATTPDTDGGPDLAALTARFATTPLRATYLFGEGADETIVVLSQDPTQDPQVSATILLGPPPGQAEEGRVITIGSKIIFCGPGGEGCFESPVDGPAGGLAEGLLGPIISGFMLTASSTDDPGFQVETDGATIAGRTGVCFTFTPQAAVAADMEFVRQCIDNEYGLTLLIEAREVGGSTVQRVMELTEFDVPLPTDFEPTGPVTTVPGS